MRSADDLIFSNGLRKGGSKAAILVCLTLVSFGLSPYLAPVIGFLSLGFIFVFRRRDFFRFFSFVSPLFFLVVLGLFIGFFCGRDVWAIWRDLFYISIFVSVLISGWALYVYGVSFENLIFGSGLYLMCLFLYDAIGLLSGISQGFSSVGELRDELGQSSALASVYIIPFLSLFPFWMRLAFLSGVFANFLSFSRSNILVLVSLFFSVPLRVRLIFVFCVFLFLPFLAMLQNNSVIDDYWDKVKHSSSEVGDTYFLDDADIHQKWRAYERFIVTDEIAAGDWVQMIFGHGLGTSVKSGIYKRQDRTSEEYTTDIAVFHDSGLFVLLKFGFLGVFVWFAWWLRVFLVFKNNIFSLGYERPRIFVFYLSVLAVILLSAFSYGFPLMRGAGVETLILGFFLGRQR